MNKHEFMKLPVESRVSIERKILDLNRELSLHSSRQVKKSINKREKLFKAIKELS